MLRNMVAPRLKEVVWTVLFLAAFSALGIFVSKQVSEPWGNLYYFLYDYLPGFNAFREASKFYILVVLGYAVGIGALVERILPKSAFENWGRFLDFDRNTDHVTPGS